MKLIKWIAITFAVLIVSCAAVALIGGPATLDTAPTAQPAAVAPTSTPAPTVAPTAKPEPTAAPASDAEDVDEYSRTMQPHMTTISNALGRLGELSQHPRFGNQTWSNDIAFLLATLRIENAAIQQITPPASMQDVHTEILAATSDYDAATYRIAKGFDTLDKDEIDAATALMASGTAHITRATAMMKAK